LHVSTDTVFLYSITHAVAGRSCCLRVFLGSARGIDSQDRNLNDLALTISGAIHVEFHQGDELNRTHLGTTDPQRKDKKEIASSRKAQVSFGVQDDDLRQSR